MPCLNPHVAYWSKPEWELKPGQKNRVVFVKDALHRDSLDDCFLIPCGKCKGCLLDRAREWTYRLQLELDSTPGRKGAFLTLTYDDAHLPWIRDDVGEKVWCTLKHEDVQVFFKRLRNRFPDVSIRYFGCGEYGPSTLRAHYHCCLFGVSLDDLVPYEEASRNELGQAVYNCRILDDCWDFGFANAGLLEPSSMAYVARYNLKKIARGGPLIDAGCKPEYNFMSRCPGIGLKYLEQHPECLDFSTVAVSTETGGKKIPLPKAFLRAAELTSPLQCAKLKAARMECASLSLKAELEGTDLSLKSLMQKRKLILDSKTSILGRKI